MRRVLPSVLALVLGAACALLVACGGSSNPHLLSSSRASSLQNDIDAVGQAVDGLNCRAAGQAVQRLRSDVANLPSSTDDRLRNRLDQGVGNLEQLALKDCQAPKTTTTSTTTTPTTTTETNTTPTTTTETSTTPTTPPQTTPTQTSTTQTTPPQTTPQTTPSGGGTGGTGVPKSGRGRSQGQSGGGAQGGDSQGQGRGQGGSG